MPASPNTDSLFQPFELKSLNLKNRIVMAPMTRNFSPGGIPGSNVADYYRRRAESDVGLILSEGIVHVEQPAEAIRAIAVLLRRYATPLELTALHTLTSLTGSLVLALALAEGQADPADVWAAAHADEDFNISQWGEDHEAAARRASRLIDFEAAVLILSAR